MEDDRNAAMFLVGFSKDLNGNPETTYKRVHRLHMGTHSNATTRSLPVLVELHACMHLEAALSL